MAYLDSPLMQTLMKGQVYAHVHRYTNMPGIHKGVNQGGPYLPQMHSSHTMDIPGYTMVSSLYTDLCLPVHGYTATDKE